MERLVGESPCLPGSKIQMKISSFVGGRKKKGNEKIVGRDHNSTLITFELRPHVTIADELSKPPQSGV